MQSIDRSLLENSRVDMSDHDFTVNDGRESGFTSINGDNQIENLDSEANKKTKWGCCCLVVYLILIAGVVIYQFKNHLDNGLFKGE